MPGKDLRFAGLRRTGRISRLRDRVVDLVRPVPDSPPSPLDHTGLRYEEHVFVFGVCGRSSTTALMRILNSTHQICVWGEPGNFIVDDLLRVIRELEAKDAGVESRMRKEILLDAFRKRDHKLCHAMAFPDPRPALDHLVAALVDLIRPAIDVRRMGFKEITVRNIETLRTLSSLFPAAHMVFLFRDPNKQWPSVERMGWPHLATLDLFLEDYERLANIYLRHGGLFVETSSLHDPQRVAGLLRRLDLGPFDASLIGDGVFALKEKRSLREDERERIESSRAFELYARMQAEERRIFGPPGA